MRRKDREVTDIKEILHIIARCDICRLALNGEDGYPYILPLNFGYTYESAPTPNPDSEPIPHPDSNPYSNPDSEPTPNLRSESAFVSNSDSGAASNFGFDSGSDSGFGTLTLYFHSALVGKKHDLINADNRATFEMDCNHELHTVASRGYCTMNFESVIGHGLLTYITSPSEKLAALTLLTDRYHNPPLAFQSPSPSEQATMNPTEANSSADTLSESLPYNTHTSEPQKQASELQKQACDSQKQACDSQKQACEPQKQACDSQKPACDSQKPVCELQKPACNSQKQACVSQKYPIHFDFNPAALPRTSVYKLTVTSLTAKRKYSH